MRRVVHLGGQHLSVAPHHGHRLDRRPGGTGPCGVQRFASDRLDGLPGPEARDPPSTGREDLGDAPAVVARGTGDAKGASAAGGGKGQQKYGEEQRKRKKTACEESTRDLEERKSGYWGVGERLQHGGFR